MLKNKKWYIMLAVVTVISLLFTLFLFSIKPKTGRNEPAPTPTEIPETEMHTNPPVRWNGSATRKLLDRKMNPVTLSATDNQARVRLLTSIGNKSSALIDTADYHIGFVKPNDFRVEIKTTDFQSAKQEAVTWFIDRGFSQQAICDLPVVFYLDFDVAQQLRSSEVVFSPLADGC